MNCQKSAEAIVPEWIYTSWEGLNNRRFLNFERYEEMCRKQTTSRRLPTRDKGGTPR
jgi:hypothetical protein